ncbi:MAG: DUF6249 domain-containing protein [Pseudomonadota bacterium]
MSFNAGIAIPIVAIAGSFAIPIVAIIMDYRRRRLISEERRAMIERGMQPPPMEEQAFGSSRREAGGTPQERRERALHGGIRLLGLGIGLALAAYLIGYVLPEGFIPRGIVGPLAIGACVVGFLGLANLVFVATARSRGGGSAP